MFQDNSLPWLAASLGLSVIGFLAMYLTQRAVVGTVGVVFLLIGAGIYAADHMVETNREKVRAETTNLCNEFRAKDPKTFSHFSADHPELVALCKTAMNMVEVGHDLRLSDWEMKETKPGKEVLCHFRANATLTVQGQSQHYPARFELTWNREGADWKIAGVRRLNPINGKPMEFFGSN